MADPRYPGFVAIQRHTINGYGLQRLRKNDRHVIVAAGPDVPLVELLVALSGKPWSDHDWFDEQGWYMAERTGDDWHISLEGGYGSFTIAHATVLRVEAVIQALEQGKTPEIGEALDADGWDRHFGWAKESGLLGSHIEHLNELARRYVDGLRQEGVVPGQAASAALLSARAEILAALEHEGLTNREQPDAIFYQLREYGADSLRLVLDALDMHHAYPLDRVALDWWLIDPAYPSNGIMGAVQFLEHCQHVFEQACPKDLEPIPFEVCGKPMFLLTGRDAGRIELRSALAEELFVEAWVRQVRTQCTQEGSVLAPPLGKNTLPDLANEWRFPTLLRAFLEQIGNGGTIGCVTILPFAEILHENDLASWLRPCPPEIRNAQEMVDWKHHELPDGLLCISRHFYNASRMYLLADGRSLCDMPTDDGYLLDPPHLWLWP